MTENTIKPISKKTGGWLRKLVWLTGILVVLLVVVYFVATSSGFLTGVILPKVSQSLGADVTVSSAKISPFSHVGLNDLKVQSAGSDPILTVKELHANYSLMSIIGGNLAVSEVVIESPVISVVQNADGTCNLDCFTKAKPEATKPTAQPAPAKSSKPPQIDIKKVALNNATVRLVKKYADGSQDVTEVSGLNFTVSDLKNGQSGKIELAAVIALQKAAQTNAAAATLQAQLAGKFDLALTPDLKPGSVKGSTSFTVSQATGPLAELNAFVATFNCELTPTDLKDLALRLAKAGTQLAEIRVSGPFDSAKSEGKLKLIISGIDRQALNLAGAVSGMDFGTTTFNSSNEIELSKGGKMISIAGGFDLAKFQVIQKTQTSPTLDLHSDYAVTVDQTAQSAVLQTLSLTGSQDSRLFLLVGLSSPMTIPLGGTSGAVGDATLNLTVTNLNLADWKSFAGDSAPGGLLNVAVKLVSQKAGQQLGFSMDTRLDNLTTGTGSAAVNQGNVRVQASGNVADMKLVKLDNYQLEVTREGKSLVNISGSAMFDRATQDADLQLSVQTALAQLMAIPDAKPADGAVSFKGHVSSKQKKIGLTGELVMTPTDRAKNTLQLTGDVDVSKPAAITGNFKVAAESLDVTKYYDLLSSLKPATNAATTASATTPPASKPDQEPSAMTLPFKNFTFDLNIGRLFLREVDIANWQTTALLDGSHVVLKPCQLTLNGAPIKATSDLNLGVPGYTYDVGFSADAIPLTPLVNSFAPDRKGQIGGASSAHAQLKGAGITGASLQKNLAGQFDFNATNLNLAVGNVRSPILKSILNIVVALPDLMKNPVAAIGGLLGGSQNSGWANQLTATPIDVIALDAKAGDGHLRLTQTEVRSAVFQVLATGDITIEPILTNSAIKIPVQIRLGRSLANQAGLVSSDTPTNVAYVALPDFLTETGTVGNPKTQLDKRGLLLLAAKAGGGIGNGIGGAAGQQTKAVANALEGLLGNKSTAGTNSAAPTNATPVSNLINLFKK